MLVLKRKNNERVFVLVGEVEVAVQVTYIEGGSVSLGFDAPKDVEIWREEIYDTRRRKAEAEAIQAAANGCHAGELGKG